MLFKEIIGQEELKNVLVRTVNEERISHAQLFFGPSGTGKLALAIAYARYVACTDRQELDACGVCPSCIKFNKLVHPDLHFAFPVLTTGKVSKDPVSDHFIEEWREVLSVNPYLSENQWYEAIGAENKQGYISRNESDSIIRKLGFKSYESEYKFLVIWLPEKMNPPAANALLKLVEEPAPKTLILMVSENTGQILPTILSRTQLIQVSPLPSTAIREALLSREGINQELVNDACRRANGDFNVALSVIESDEQDLQHLELFSTLMRYAFQRKIQEISGVVDQLATIGRERQKQFLQYALRFTRENFMLTINKDELSFMSAQEEGFARKFHPYIHQGNVFEMVEQLNLAHNHIEANGNPRLVFMDLAIKIIILLKTEKTESA